MSQSSTSAPLQILQVGDIRVQLVRKRVKNINLRIGQDGTVRVSAPPRTPQATIEAFVASKHDWIERALDRVRSSMQQTSRTCADGHTLYLWGEPLTVRVRSIDKMTGNRRYVFQLVPDTMTLEVSLCGEPDQNQLDRALGRWLNEQLANQIQAVLPACTQTVGRQCSRLRIRAMKSRWGSCNTKTGVITLNSALVHFDERCLVYVLTHELCHLHEPSHNARFHQLMDAYYPDWRTVRRMLNSRQ